MVDVEDFVIQAWNVLVGKEPATTNKEQNNYNRNKLQYVPKAPESHLCSWPAGVEEQHRTQCEGFPGKTDHSRFNLQTP